MSKKIRMIRTMVIEYIPEAEAYPEGFTIEQMAELDANTDDRELLFEEGLISDEITYEIVEE